MRFGRSFGGGFNLPPGCGTLPGEVEYPCEVCGKMPDDCICPECPVCHSQGDPNCYSKHGLELTLAQFESKVAADRAEDEHLKREKEYAEDMEKDWSARRTKFAKPDTILDEEEWR
jgi:hypothetical protein